MNTIPSTITSTATSFTPAFPFVGTADRHADALACVASIASKSLAEVWSKAEELGLPKAGPYNQMIDSDFIARLLASYGFVGTIWKESTKVSNLPDLCIALVDYDTDWEVGRYVVIHRAKCSHDAKILAYAIDPAAKDQKLHVRTDLEVLAPAWYIGVHPMKPSAAPAKK